MDKTKEELEAIKSEYVAVMEKLKDLTSEELEEVAGGYKYIGNFKFSLNKGDCFREGRSVYKVKYDYPELDYSIIIDVICDQYAEAAPGEYHFTRPDCLLSIRGLSSMEYLGINIV